MSHVKTTTLATVLNRVLFHQNYCFATAYTYRIDSRVSLLIFQDVPQKVKCSFLLITLCFLINMLCSKVEKEKAKGNLVLTRFSQSVMPKGCFEILPTRTTWPSYDYHKGADTTGLTQILHLSPLIYMSSIMTSVAIYYTNNKRSLQTSKQKCTNSDLFLYSNYTFHYCISFLFFLKNTHVQF